jgi:hypothetical protein
MNDFVGTKDGDFKRRWAMCDTDQKKTIDNNCSKISVQFSLTVNLGDWNSAKLGCSLEDVIDNPDEFEIKFDHIYKKLRDKVVTELTILNKVYGIEKRNQGLKT